MEATTAEKATQTWWRVWLDAIDAREVVNVTPKTVTYIEPGKNGSRDRKQRSLRDSASEHWFDNKRDAVEYVRSRIASRLAQARDSVARLSAHLAAFNEAHPED